MNDQTEPERSAKEISGGMIAAQGSQIEFFGAIFLFILALFLLFALLRAQKRHRALMRELMEAKMEMETKAGE